MPVIGGLVGLILALIILGAVLWLITLLPIDPSIKQIIRGIVIFVVVLYLLFWLLSIFGYVEMPAIRLR